MTTYLSGIQPSGQIHLGNYFGAIREHVDSQEVEGEHFFFLADYHALTTCKDPEELRTNTRELAVTYLSFGLDPDRVVLFRQSDVPEVLELTWLLSTVTGMGLLERAHSYKDKTARGIKPSVGLFTYPVLMSADILAYDSTHVPVGKDQVQHVEMAADMAGYFNGQYSEVFTIPQVQIPDQGFLAKVPGLDGQKMSKSYDNGIWVFEEGKRLKQLVGKITTDSRPPEEAKDPDGVLLIDFLTLFLDETELGEWRERVRAGGEGAPGYGHLKVRLVEAMQDSFADARARRKEFLADPGEVERLLAAGAEKARARASATR
ncbi:MAG: tryptophan--tRNA ligase, partial [Planctomycetota bacterium]|nr:tryptophan--tRNA ligase [Planctomycetota bacterium]